MRIIVSTLLSALAVAGVACGDPSTDTIVTDRPEQKIQKPVAPDGPTSSTATTESVCLPSDEACAIDDADDTVMHVTCTSAPQGIGGALLACTPGAGPGTYDCEPACIRTAASDCELCGSSPAYQCPSKVAAPSCTAPDDAGRICCL